MALAHVLPPDARPIPMESANGLSRRQQQVLTLAAQGLPLKLIGYELAITVSTVGSHLGAALKRLGIRRSEVGLFGAVPTLGGLRRLAGVDHHTLDVPPALTPAERAIVGAMLRGWSNAQIAQHRRRSDRTVANQVACAFRKLGIGSRTEFYARAAEWVASKE